MKLFVIFIVFGFLVGCAVGPKLNKPSRELPKEYRFSAAKDSTPQLQWKDLYSDTTLETLIETALKENIDLKRAIARIDEARAMAGMSKADFYPAFGYGAAAGVLAPSQNNINEIGGGTQRDIFYGRASMSWELDLWGKLRHANRAAAADLLGSTMNQQAVMVSLIAETASIYFHLRSLDQQLEIAKQTLISRKESTRLIVLRFEGGDVAELDKFQAQTQEYIAAAMIPDIERQIVQTENNLNLLLGKSFGPVKRGTSNEMQKFLSTIPEGLPSDLIRRRPDVMSTEQKWIAQNERAGVAQAARFPSFGLTGGVGLASQDLSALTSGTASTWSVLGTVTGPIFNFGKNKRRVEAEKAKTMQLGLDYEKAVLTALAEVDYSLFAINSYKTEYSVRQQQVATAEGAVILSRARYNDGFTNYSEVLDNERTFLDAQMSTAKTLEQQLQSIVQLYKALGGGSDASKN